MPEGIFTKQLWDPFLERFRVKEMQQESCKTAHGYKTDMRLLSCPPCSYSFQSNTVWEHQCPVHAALCSLNAASTQQHTPLHRPCQGAFPANHRKSGQFLLVDREDDSEGPQGRREGLVITWSHTVVTSGSEHWAANPNWEHWCVHIARVEQGLGNFAVSNPCSVPNNTVLHSTTPALRAFYFCYTKMKRRNMCFAQRFTAHNAACFCCTILNRHSTNLAKCSAVSCCSCDHDVQL